MGSATVGEGAGADSVGEDSRRTRVRVRRTPTV